MIRSRMARWFTFLVFLSSSVPPAFAETIELVTYYPSSATTGDLHVTSLTVGTAYNGVTPPDGVAAIYDKLWIGQGYTNPDLDPAALRVVGFPGVLDKVLFLPGADGGSLNVGIGTADPAASSILELASTTQGFLPPRMTTAQRDAIAGAEAGLLIFNTTTNQHEFFNGTAWSSSGSTGIPEGTVQMFAGNAIPAGWLECNGQAVNRGTFAALFAAIGTTWGAGNGTTTFNLPDLRGRGPIGAGQGTGLTNRALGAKGGEEMHTLTVAEMPSHTHAINDGSTDTGRNFGPNGVFTNQSTYAHVRLMLAEGGNQPHNNMQPFTSVRFIIKT